MAFVHYHPLLRLWWRRQVFYFRRVPCAWLIFLALVLVYLLTRFPNPFSRQYTHVVINQDVQWENIQTILQVKEQILYEDPLSKQIKVIERGIEQTRSSNPILILIYTTVFLDMKYCRLSADRLFGQSCPSKLRCQWTCDRKRLREADAVIIHAYDVQYHQGFIPQRSHSKANAIWILWSDEPPSIVDYTRFQSHQFNWTISYKSNSEVSLATYGLFSERSRPLTDLEYNQWLDEQFFRRKDGALWFVSNCDAKQRLNYFFDLQRLSTLRIEGYGRCVDYYPMHWCKARTQCESDYLSTFQFYLSFESNTCRDYITEKFFKPFHHGLIPIVHGPDRLDYQRLAPVDSFIHIDDYQDDLARLARHLESVHNNRTLFSRYHQWRRSHEVIVDPKALERVRMCELCHRLTQVRDGDVRYYTDIERFYREGC